MSAPYSGGCQCGAVRYEVTAEPTVIYACHCTDCQTQSGAAFGMSMVVPEAALNIVKGQPKSFRRTGESGHAMSCHFCGDCGTRIYHIPGGIPENRNIKPGTLDDASWVKPAAHLWCDSAQPWVEMAEDTRQFNRQPTDRSWLTKR